MYNYTPFRGIIVDSHVWLVPSVAVRKRTAHAVTVQFRCSCNVVGADLISDIQSAVEPDEAAPAQTADQHVSHVSLFLWDVFGSFALFMWSSTFDLQILDLLLPFVPVKESQSR